MAEHYKQLSMNITYYRKLRDMTQEDLAERTGVSTNHISRIEGPYTKSMPSMELLFKIADTLEIEPSKLFEVRI